MRSLILVSFVCAGGSAWADASLPSLQNTLQTASCPSSGGDAASAEGKTCKAVTTAFCSEMSDAQCPGNASSPGSGKQANVVGSTFVQVYNSATSLSRAYAQAANRAGRCCGRNSDTCKGLFPVGSPEAKTASDAIAAASIQAGTSDPKASESDGLKNKCSVFKTQSDNATTVSAGVAGMCKAYKSICVDGFKALAAGVRSKAPSGDVNFENLAKSFDDKASQCDAYSADAASQSAQQMVQNSMQAQGCENVTGDNVTPASAGDKKTETAAEKKDDKKDKGGGGDMKDIMGMMGPLMQALQKKDDKSEDNSDQAAAAPDCSNPATAGCASVAAATPWSTSLGSGGAAGSSSTGGKFDVADTSGVQPAGLTPSNPGQSSPISVASVPGGGGGGVGGMGGGGGANLGGGGGGGGGYAPKTNTDIMHGEGGGGGGLAAMNAGMSTAAAGGSGGFTYGKGGKPEPESVDWRQFLPGGAKDPTRKLAGATPARVEIQPASTNIFTRVSERIRSRCAAGLLRDCN